MKTEKAIERIKAFRDYLCAGNPIWDVEECKEAFDIAIAAMEQRWMPAAIDNISTAEKVGKWILHPEIKNIYGGTYIECSECREKYVVQHIEDEKFCRNCGARMVDVE